MIPRPPKSTRTDTLFPYTALFRSQSLARLELVGEREHLVLEPAAPVAQSRVDVEQARGRGAEPVMLAAGIEFRKLLADERFEDAETGARAELGGARNREIGRAHV